MIKIQTTKSFELTPNEIRDIVTTHLKTTAQIDALDTLTVEEMYDEDSGDYSFRALGFTVVEGVAINPANLGKTS